MDEFETEDRSFQQAELQSERTRVKALLAVFGGLLALILVRGIVSLTQGQRGESWPFIVALIIVTAYELVWLRMITRALNSGGKVSDLKWRISVLVESLLPTVALVLQVHSSAIGPQRAPVRAAPRKVAMALGNARPSSTDRDCADWPG